MENIVIALLDLLKFALPAGIIGWALMQATDRVITSKDRESMVAMRSRMRNETLTTRLQAYERLLLFLERSEPSALVMRLHRPGMSAALLQSDLLRSIRNEYEHNLTQQLYVSAQSWAKVQEARDAVQQIVQAAGSKMGNTSTGLDLSNAIFTIVATAGISPTQGAIDALKKEAQELL